MALIQTTILIFTFFSFFIGQIFRINLKDVSFPLLDIGIILLSLVNIYQHIRQKNLKSNNKYFFYFLSFTWVFLIINLLKYQIYSLIPFFYLIRLTCLLSLIIYPPIFDNKLKNFFLVFVFANIIFGLIQYFFWPDFTYFNINHWDPHLFRLISTYFDPTFTGLIYLFFLINIFINKKIPYRWPLFFLSYTSMALTYSRSTYFSFLVAFGFIAIKLKKLNIFLLSIILILLTILLLPRQPGEGTKLERTSSIVAKIENYQEGLILFTKSPIFGHGYNNLLFVRNVNPKSHAISGFDGSLLTILTTTGIIGLSLFILGISRLYHQSNLLKKTMLISLLVHSIFANSFLYPWILLSLVLF